MDKNNTLYNPIDIINDLTNKNAPLMSTFHEEYKAYVETLNMHVFEPNGYKLVAVKV